MLILQLSVLMGEKKWTRSQVARFTDFRPNDIGDWWNGEETGKITLDKLDVLCDLFGCELTESLVYVPNSPPRIEFNEKGEPVKRLYYEEPANPKKGKKKRQAK